MIHAIVEQHASNAAFLWELRDAATRRAHYKLPDLCQLDDRLEAHLDGLRIAGDGGWAICKAALEDGKAGEVFTAAFMAVERGDLEGIAAILDVLDASEASPVLARGIVSALGWAPADTVAPILSALLDPACPPALQYLGIAASAVHRNDPGEALVAAIASDDERLRRRALEAAGELGRADLLLQLERQLGAEPAEIRFSAAWAAALLGSPRAAGVLWELSAPGSPFAERAFPMAVRTAAPADAAHWIGALRSRPESCRTAVLGAGALGDPVHVPWLVDCMATPDLARPAAESFTMITGLDLEEEGLKGDAPEGFRAGPTDDPGDEDVDMDPDDDLRFPAVDAVRASWHAHRAGLAAHTRHLLGKPISVAWLEQVLRGQGQRRRAAAAIELALLAPGRPLFEVRAPGLRQTELLGGGS